MIILFIIISIILFVVLMFFRNKHNIEYFDSPNKTNIKFSKITRTNNNGISLKDNYGKLPNANKLMSKKSSIALAYSLDSSDEDGLLLYIPDNYVKISIKSKNTNINIFLTHLSKEYHYIIDRYSFRSYQNNLIICLILNNYKHELYINNKKLNYYDSMLINKSNKKYSISSQPIIINKNKKLKGILYSLVTYNKIINSNKIKNIFLDMKKYFKKNILKKNVKKKKIRPKKLINHAEYCNFNNRELCKICGKTEINLKNPKIKYQSPKCEKKIKSYCSANNDYVCDILDTINNF